MSAERALANMAEWPAYEEAEGNSTAQRQHPYSGVNVFKVSQGWTGHIGIKLITNWEDEPIRRFIVKDPVHHVVTPGTVFVTLGTDLIEDAASYRLADSSVGGTVLVGESYRSTLPLVPWEYESLTTITHAPKELWRRIRFLGAIHAPESATEVWLEAPKAGEAWLGRDADEETIPEVGDRVTDADHGLIALATSYRHEEVALRVPFEDDE